MVFTTNLERHLVPTELVIAGRKTSIELPHFQGVGPSSDYIVRPMNREDFEIVAQDNDPSLADKITVEYLNNATRLGFTFEKGVKGDVLWVAEHVPTGTLAGRAYVKTWHGDDFGKPKLMQHPDGSVEVISAAQFSNNAGTLAELGGWYVNPAHRGHGLAEAMVYASLDFVKRMQVSGKSANFGFIVNVGPFRPADNDLGEDYGLKLIDAVKSNGFDCDKLDDLVGRGIILRREEHDEVFSDLMLRGSLFGSEVRYPYSFGMPRNATAPAYHIARKITAENEQPLLKGIDTHENAFGLYSPVSGLKSVYEHPEHGGNYTPIPQG